MTRDEAMAEAKRLANEIDDCYIVVIEGEEYEVVSRKEFGEEGSNTKAVDYVWADGW